MASRQIKMGPGKFDLMLALFDHQKIRFNFENPTTQLSARISAVGLEDRETETWSIRGFVIHPRPIQERQDFTATYSTYTRQGSAVFRETCTTCNNQLDDNGFCERCAGHPLPTAGPEDLVTALTQIYGAPTLSIKEDQWAALHRDKKITVVYIPNVKEYATGDEMLLSLYGKEHMRVTVRVTQVYPRDAESDIRLDVELTK